MRRRCWWEAEGAILEAVGCDNILDEEESTVASDCSAASTLRAIVAAVILA